MFLLLEIRLEPLFLSRIPRFGKRRYLPRRFESCVRIGSGCSEAGEVLVARHGTRPSKLFARGADVSVWILLLLLLLIFLLIRQSAIRKVQVETWSETGHPCLAVVVLPAASSGWMVNTITCIKHQLCREYMTWISIGRSRSCGSGNPRFLMK